MACLCSIIRVISIWILFLQIVTLSRGYSPDVSVCDVADLEPAQVQQCSDRNGIPITTSSIILTGSHCEIICPYEEVKAWVTCDDGEWSNDYQSYCTRVAVAKKRRSRPKRWLFGLLVGLFFNSLFGRRSNRDNTPPSLTCPPNIQTTAVQLQTWAVVSWAEPTANDGRDGGITPTRQGKASGSYFSEGVTPIGYYARDKSGNMARCSFTVTVNVVRCTWPVKVNNGYFMCHPSDDARYGATCRFGCYPGYKLIGISLLECLVTGQWNNNQPYCEQKTCPTLPLSVGSLQYTCTDSNKFRSICTYSCISGYDITPGMSRVRVCTAYGTWRGAEPTCTDIEPPVFKGCQHTVYAYADRNSTTGVATWTEPIAVDNHDPYVVVQKEKSTSPTPGDRLSAGNYKIVYKAVDAAGNMAQNCQTEVILKVLTCPVVYPTPFLSVTCPWGTKYGSQCEFDCDPGSVRNGSKVVVCEKSGTGNHGYWTFSGNKQPYCEVIQKCLDEPNIPQNGALACDNWIGGKFCQMLCQQGYDVKIGHSTIDMLVCGDSGKWLPAGTLPLPDCARSFWADRGRLRMSASYYFTGDCTNVLVQEEIKNSFIKTLSTSVYNDACLVFANDCKVDNVQVKCGHIARRKRSGDMRIDFDITAEFDNVSSADSFAQFRRHQSDIVDKITEAKSDGILDFNVTGSGFMEAKDFENYDVVLDCPERTVPSYKTLTCVECSAGTYYNTTSETCEMCPRGTFQSLSRQLNCLPCPFGQTTTSAGTKQQSQCHDGCQPGSWSPNGIPECSLCAVGTYSDSYGETECTHCPGSTSTVEEGADSILKCQEFDLRMTKSESQVSADVDVSGIDRITLTFWLKRDFFTEDNFIIQLNERETRKMIFFIDIGSATKIGDQREVKTATNTGNGKWHFYILKQNNDSTELYEDGELRIRTDLPFTNLMNMSISFNGSGTTSRLNVWTNDPGSFSRILEIANKCGSSKTGDILSWKAFELTSGDNVYKQMPSECDDVDDCRSDPCINGGKCTDLSSGYECQCYYGFKGDSCEENIDDCADHACENNATCVDGAANYTCDCPDGYKGELCEIAMVDGSWSDWGEWSSCSVTCGNGTQQRFRVCNDPAPDNGGLDCPDSSTENRSCTENSCPECSQLEKLANVIWTCVNDSENINCTIACTDGYDFDHEVKPYYMCGIDTFYLWDFQTDDNPAGKMPACQKMKDSEKLRVSYTASYKDLECDSTLKYTNIHKSVPETVQFGLDTIECVSTGVCFLDKLTITDCNKRQKRSLTSSTAGIYVSFSCNPISHGTDTCYNSLYSAVNDLQLLAMNRTLDVDILGSTYPLNASNARADSSVTCSTGMVPIQFYCIPCAPGRYYSKEECVKCDFGTYQDLSGQLSCKECPDGTTTPGRESRSVIECSVKYDTELNETVSIIVGITVSAVILCILVISFIVVRRCIFPWKRKEKEMPQTSPSDRTAVIERNTDEVLFMKPSDVWTTVISPRSLKQEDTLHKNGEKGIDVIHLH